MIQGWYCKEKLDTSPRPRVLTVKEIIREVGTIFQQSGGGVGERERGLTRESSFRSKAFHVVLLSRLHTPWGAPSPCKNAHTLGVNSTMNTSDCGSSLSFSTGLMLSASLAYKICKLKITLFLKHLIFQHVTRHRHGQGITTKKPEHWNITLHTQQERRRRLVQKQITTTYLVTQTKSTTRQCDSGHATLTWNILGISLASARMTSPCVTDLTWNNLLWSETQAFVRNPSSK